MSTVELLYIDDHEALILADTMSQYRDRPRIRALIQALAVGSQLIEDQTWILLGDTALANATGAQLDQFGGLISEERGGLGDNEYRRSILGRSAAIRSEGSTNEVINVVLSMLSIISIEETSYPPLSSVVSVVLDVLLSAEFSRRVASIIETARPMGIRADAVQAPVGYFGFSGNGNASGFGAGGFAGVIQ